MFVWGGFFLYLDVQTCVCSQVYTVLLREEGEGTQHPCGMCVGTQHAQQVLKPKIIALYVHQPILQSMSVCFTRLSAPKLMPDLDGTFGLKSQTQPNVIQVGSLQ